MSLRLIKKYPNRRLYDTEASAYITLVNVKAMIIGGQAFKVVDAKTEEDLTRSILLQIILEEEAGGQPIFSEAMMRQMIRFYGHAMQSTMGSYLERTLQVFVDLQSKMADQADALSGMTKPFVGGASNIPGADQWSQLLGAQSPMMQNLMNSYIDQTKSLFSQVPNPFVQSSAGMWPGFPFGTDTPKGAERAAEPSVEPDQAVNPDSEVKATASSKRASTRKKS